MLTLKDIGLTQYELLDGGARWYWDPRYIAPLFGKEEPLDIITLVEIDRALARRSGLARWKSYIRRKYKGKRRGL